VALSGKGLGISAATSYRYRYEAIDVLAARAPDLHEALARGHDEGWSHVVGDGKVVGTDRCRVKPTSTKGKTIDTWYSGKTTRLRTVQRRIRADQHVLWEKINKLRR